ncbi:MAG: hypothetical protein Tsb0013_06370 [Phycisphaerales bacterium]
MSVAPIRPRFELRPAGVIDACIDALRAAFEGQGAYVYRALDHHVDITIARDQRKLWSPCVHLEFEREPDTGSTLVHALIGPHPNVWTLYAVTTLHLLLLVVFAVPFGLVQVSLGHAPWALWIALGGVAGVGGMYAISQVGRRLAREDTAELHRRVREALGVA